MRERIFRIEKKWREAALKLTHVHLFLWVFIHLRFYPPINPAEKLKWFIVCVNNPKLAPCVFKSHFSVYLVFPVTISCCSDLIFLQRIMNVSSPSVYFSLSLCLANKALQIQPNSPTFPRRKCCERLHRLLLYSVNKIQPAATSGIFRSFHNHPTSTAAPRADELTRGSPQQEPNSYNCSSGRSKHAAQIRLSANVKLLNASHTHTCLMFCDRNNQWEASVTPGFGQLSLTRS